MTCGCHGKWKQDSSPPACPVRGGGNPVVDANVRCGYHAGMGWEVKALNCLLFPGSSPQADGRLFARADWVAAAITAFVALCLYVVTLAPTVTLEQSGAFAVAGQYLGIGRAPGYPLWHLLARLFISVFGFVRYRGCPNPAWATNFMSAFFGALCCGLVALIVCRVGRALCSHPEGRGEGKAFAAAVATGLLFAISHTMWSQAVITETHTLTLFLVLLFLVVCMAWINRPGRRTACGLAAVFGLGLAQSHIILLLFPPLLLGILLGRARLCREFFVANAFLWVIPCLLLRMGLPMPWAVAAVAASAILGIALPLRLSGCGRTALAMVLIIALGLSLYLYLPFASAGRAPMQFGYARTWRGFLHVFTRGQYERISPTNVFAAPLVLVAQLKWYFSLLGRQFIGPLGLVALIPLVCLPRLRNGWRRWWAVCLLAFFMFSVVLLIGANPRADIQDANIQRVKFIPSFAMWAVFIGLGLLMVLDWIDELARGAEAPAR